MAEAFNTAWDVLKMPPGYEGADRFDPETGQLREGEEWPRTESGTPMLPVRAMDLHANSPAGASIASMKQAVETAIASLKEEKRGLGIYGAFPDFSIPKSQQRIREIAQSLLNCCGDV